MSYWLIALVIRGYEFCQSKDVVKVACTKQVVECYLNDDKQWCEKHFWEYYDGA